ncbi:oligosaccharide flippase family protein [Patescibacteria group bacterium]
MAEAIDEHLDQTQEIALQTVKTRAVKGVVVLTGRTFLLSLLSLAATGFLTVFLDPSQFGVFWIVSAVVNFLAYFSDIGLAAALIQKKEKIQKDDLKTTFTVQQALVLVLIVILFLISPLLVKVYSLSFEGKLLLYSLGISLVMSSLKTIPSILLERELEFSKLVIPQVLENLAYNLVAVFLAWKGFGIRSFSYAVIIRGFVGLTSMYILKPWLPGFAFSRKSLKKLLSFGVPYQLNTLLATLKDDGMTAVLGGILGPAGIGILGWAQKWGQAPLRFFMDHILKVTFPAFARMQDEKEELSRTLTRSIFFISFLVFPSLIGLLVVAPTLVNIIPRYAKWTPALFPLSLIAINTVFAATTTQLTNVLNSIGRIKVTLKLMIMWTTLTWLLVPFLAIKFGVNGAAAGYSLVGVSSVVAIIVARRHIKFSLIEATIKPLLASFVMGGALLIVRGFLPVSLTSVFLMIGSGLIIYTAGIYLLVGVSIIDDAKKSFKTFFGK